MESNFVAVCNPKIIMLDQYRQIFCLLSNSLAWNLDYILCDLDGSFDIFSTHLDISTTVVHKT